MPQDGKKKARYKALLEESKCCNQNSHNSLAFTVYDQNVNIKLLDISVTQLCVYVM